MDQAPTNAVDSGTGQSTDPDRTTYAYTGTGRLSDYVNTQTGPRPHGDYTYDARASAPTPWSPRRAAVTTTDYTYTGLPLHKLSALRAGTQPRPGGSPISTTSTASPMPASTAAPATSTHPGGLRHGDHRPGDVVELLDATATPSPPTATTPGVTRWASGNVGTGIWTQDHVRARSSATLATEIATRQVLRYAGYCYDSRERAVLPLGPRTTTRRPGSSSPRTCRATTGSRARISTVWGTRWGIVDPTGSGSLTFERWFRAPRLRCGRAWGRRRRR